MRRDASAFPDDRTTIDLVTVSGNADEEVREQYERDIFAFVNRNLMQ